MVNANSLRVDVNAMINDNGIACRFRYFTPTLLTGSDYDDYSSLAKSGNDFWTSGLFQPIDAKFGSKESILVQQGQLLTNDSKLYVYGNVDTSGTWKLQVGSPAGEQYSLANNNGVVAQSINGINVFKKLYIRVLTTGSISGE